MDTKCIRKTDGTTIDVADDLDLVMPMYNLIQIIDIVQIIMKQQEVCGFIQNMKQLILMQILQMLIILNISCTRLNY